VQALQHQHDQAKRCWLSQRQCSDAEKTFADNVLHAHLHGNKFTKGAKQARSLRTTLAGSTLQSFLDM